MNKIKLITVTITLLVLTSCALKPIKTEYTFVKTDLEKVELNKLGDGNILIYNGANILHKLDNTARLNVWIDNKPLGQIKPSEYVIINLKNGQHHFKTLHIDMFNMRSEHEIEVDRATKVIKIKPTVTSNKLEVTNELPSNFENFKYSSQS
jgi:hypothetical protein